ncbi:hypothetical protein HMPREF9244_01059, partial [Alloscardovia omnicolens F0580]
MDLAGVEQKMLFSRFQLIPQNVRFQDIAPMRMWLFLYVKSMRATDM